jgi:RNA-directed DNA polymerase
MFSAFLPAVSKDALKRMSEEVRSWRIHLRSGTELEDIASWVNPIIRGSPGVAGPLRDVA